MKRYSEYKDSGVEWIGEIPSHWEKSKIYRVFNLIGSGGTPDSQNELYYDNGNINWLNTGDLNDESIKYTNRQINNLAIRRFSTLKLYPKNSLVIAMYGATIGKLGITDIETTTNQACCVLSNPIGLNIRYMFYWFLSSRSYIINLSQGGGQPNISQQIIKDLNFFKPPIEEQNKIVDYLDKKTSQIENLISKKEELIETLKASRTTLISETVTKGLDKDIPMKDSGVEWIGEIPSHWESSKLKYNIDTTKGYAFKSDLFGEEGVPVVKASDIKNKTIVNNDNYISSNIANKYKSVMLLEGDIIMSTVGSTPDVKNSAVGQLAYIPENVEGSLLNQNTVILRINHNNLLDKRFLFYVLCSNTFRRYLDLYAHGTANQASLSLVDILNYDIAIPNKEEQYKIVEYLDRKLVSIDILISNVEEQIEILKKAKQKLITEVVTGKINVTNL